MDQARTKVLFLCTGNSARSQLAEALLRHIAPEEFMAFSAGTDPKPVHPLTIKVLEEIGVSTEGLRSKSLKEYLGKQFFGFIIIVCSQAAESCPTVWPGISGRITQLEHAFFSDPAAAEGGPEEQLEAFRSVRDEIRAYLEKFVAEHGLATHSA
ncbi:arsenate reductase ArsC [bacterium]|nr:arsenate reductase ArsC [bacterium]